jgi:predicted peptidase
LLYLPKDYATSHAKYPLLLFLHGAGERGTDLEKVKRHGPPKEIANGRDFPFIVISPQCLEFQFWDVHDLTGLLDDIEHHYRVDKDREYVTGLSMGGFGTFALLAHSPERFAAAAPIAGAADTNIAPRLAHIPIWATHGVKDAAVPFDADQKIVDAIKAAGGDIKFTPIPEGGHDVWTDVYSGTELFDWLLTHKLPR